jgi:hypothetical protein
VAFDDESVADFFDRQVDAGRQPEQFGRIWVHTHPGDSPLPSQTDEETFDRVFGNATWAVMFILACGGTSYARLRFNVGPSGETEVPVQVDFRHPFAGCDLAAWSGEYRNNVQSDETIVNSALEMGLLDNWEEPPLHSRINLPAYEGDEFDDFRDHGDRSL